MSRFTRSLLLFLVSGIFFFYFRDSVFAATTPFRSAQSVTTSGNPAYTSIENCSITDGKMCSRAMSIGAADLYFRTFGDFELPDGAVVTGIRLRVNGYANAAMYVGVSYGTTFMVNCQFPSDLWTMWALYTPYPSVYTAYTGTSSSFAKCVSANHIKSDLLTWRINYASKSNWFANIDNFEVAYEYIPPASPTPTPTVYATPTPTPVQPFLDLPWDYRAEGKKFDDVAFDPTSWFDHKYPLQDVPCCINKIMRYDGVEKEDFYRSHSGYDYGARNGVFLDTPVLAAASGIATLIEESSSGGAGNVIKIDHGNGYQTWYEHLSKDGLIAADEDDSVEVVQGQTIGKVGMTGNTNGPHIHMSVLNDSNNNGNFQDDYPWGLTDPFGWSGEDSDPWTEWERGGRFGAKSLRLYSPQQKPTIESVSTNGGLVSVGDILISIPSGSLDREFILSIENGPFENIGNSIRSIIPSTFLNAADDFGDEVTRFIQPLQITYDYKSANLLNIKEDSLRIYWFNEDAEHWEELPSTQDLDNKKVSAETLHFSQFALMGEVKDLVPPTTTFSITGDLGQENWYRSDVTVELNGGDDEIGVGLLYTLYRLDGGDWEEYLEPIQIYAEGKHKIEYQSFDRADNKEERKTLIINIDKTSPEARVYIDQDAKALVVEGKDSNLLSVSEVVNEGNKNKSEIRYLILDKALNQTSVLIKTNESSKKDMFKVYSVEYNTILFVFPDNLYQVDYKDTDKKSYESRQKFTLDGSQKIDINYSGDRNLSEIEFKNINGEKIREEKGGLVILQLFTDKGTLKYSY